jgi:ribosomal protein L23
MSSKERLMTVLVAPHVSEKSARVAERQRFGGRPGRRSDFKKAYVSLAEGQTIDFAGVEK